MKKWTLQIRVTAIVGVILTAACLLLTTNSLLAARTYYGDYAALIESGQMVTDSTREERTEMDPALKEQTEIDPALEEQTEMDPALEEQTALDLPLPGALYEAAAQKFSAQSLLAMAIIVVLGLACTYWATGRLLYPLRRLTESVREVDDLHLDRRVATEEAQGEVLALAESFNGMLGRLEESFLIQKSFAANAAHELKTPLAVIKSSLQVLEMDPRPMERDYREFMADTSDSLERIIKTVEGLLSLANPEAVPMDETVELRPLLDQAVRELSGSAEEHGTVLSVSGQASTVRGNPNLLYRAFYNLIENAIKYNRPDGTVAVTLQQDGDTVCVLVEDNGFGIPADALPHIFEPFYRADPSRSQQIPGSGLGLAVVQMILARHGASIQAASQKERGTVFTVVFH